MREDTSRTVAGRRRLGALMIALAAAGALASCGQPAFDNSFNTQFDKSTHDSCLPSAVQNGAAPAAAEAYCSCVVTELDKLTVQQKMALNASSPEIKTAATACISKIQAAAAPANAAP